MKKILSTVIASGIVLVAANAHAGSTTGTATATVIPDITVSQTAGLNFGTFAPGTSGGTVVVSNSGTSATGSVQSISSGTRGAFGVQGGASANYNITVDNSVTLSDGNSHSMSAALSAPTTGSLDNNGNGSFNVDGTLTVGANQVAGTYTGQYNVTVNY